MTKDNSSNPSKPEKPKRAAWTFVGSAEALEALCKRDQAQAEALARAMRVVENRAGRGGETGEVRRLRRELTRLKQAGFRKRRKHPRRRRHH